jgi:uncharacterized protein YciI
MPVFAVHYRYADRPDEVAEHRPAHRAFLRELFDQGVVLAAGAYPQGPAGALLVFRADSADRVAELLRSDPFQRQGLVTDCQIRLGGLAMGPWTE